VAGGTVRAHHGAPESGSVPIHLRADAHSDALFSTLPATTTAIANHVDAITELPPNATWLARNDQCPYQGFRVGDAAWGVQFHPEADAARVRRWDPDQLRAKGFDPEQVYARALADEPASAAAWQAFTQRFANLVTRG
jgi:GMP synthase-like glutamine amidotransferase